MNIEERMNDYGDVRSYWKGRLCWSNLPKRPRNLLRQH